MVNIENLIFEGTCFAKLKLDVEEISKLKEVITKFMNKQNYIASDQPIFFQDNFLTMEFSILTYEKDVKLKIKIKRALGLLSKDQYKMEKYACKLESTRDDLPFKVYFLISRRKMEGVEGFLIKIRTEPVKLYCIRQLGHSTKISDIQYENIAVTNKHFIEQIMAGLWVTAIDEPKAIKKFVKTPLIEKLERLEFHKIVELLKRGQTNLEKGGEGIIDGLTDLRSALEKFVYQLVEKTGEKPYSQQKLGQNLKTLEEKKGLSKEMGKYISKTLDNWLYQLLSDKPVHNRENINITDAKFLFLITEDCMEYMLNKVLYGV